MADVTNPPAKAALAGLEPALPFWASLGLLPLVAFCASNGGWTLLLLPVSTWWLFLFLDVMIGRKLESADPQIEEARLFWHKAITILWFPLQFMMIFGGLWFVTATDHLAGWEEIILFWGVGIATGTVGINYAHELCHQKTKLERWMADLILGSVLYGHFRSEHLLVHHRYVGTPRDPVTARYNESFYKFYARVLVGCMSSAFAAEKEMLRRKGKPVTDPSNPFWRYWALQITFTLLALAIGGWWGVLLFVIQAANAILQLELVNYVEHYGLTRKHLGGGKYEHVQPHHSWNADYRASNWLLINLQRHSDHHFKPDRRFPLLQTYEDHEAPTLPFSYPLMTLAALLPRVWRRWMNPKVRAWRDKYYPEVTNWDPYTKARNPTPR